MKVKIQAGAELDMLTQDEMRAALREVQQEIRQGVRFPRRTATAATAGGVLTLTDDTFSPKAGYCWGVNRISSPNLGAAESLSVYLNETNTSGFVGKVLGTSGFLVLDLPGLVLVPLDKLIVTGTGLAAAAVTVNLQVTELPIQLMWQLIG